MGQAIFCPVLCSTLLAICESGKCTVVKVKTSGAKVVNVSSTGHRAGTMDFDNLVFEGSKGYGRHRAYSRSKLANLMFTYKLQLGRTPKVVPV